ncbi:MAG: cupin domain-containing protein [Myxococcales bacterium]
MRTLLVLSLCVLCGCASAPKKEGYSKVISPAQSGNPTSWDENEMRAPVAIRTLRRTPEASFHLARIKAELGRRLHEKSDLTLVVVNGQLELSLGDETVQAGAGDVVEIPRGTPYAVLNKGRDAGVLYLVFTPGLADDDTRNRPVATSESSWRWNLWLQ